MLQQVARGPSSEEGSYGVTDASVMLKIGTKQSDASCEATETACSIATREFGCGSGSYV